MSIVRFSKGENFYIVEQQGSLQKRVTSMDEKNPTTLDRNQKCLSEFTGFFIIKFLGV